MQVVVVTITRVITAIVIINIGITDIITITPTALIKGVIIGMGTINTDVITIDIMVIDLITEAGLDIVISHNY